MIFAKPNQKRTWRRKWVVLGILLVISLLILVVLAEEEATYRQEKVTFYNGNIKLVGTLVLPLKQGVHPCIVFVHGSSDAPRDGYGYYKPYWKQFAQDGFCSLSWDKPGSGESDGDWRNQSMTDRAHEVLAAVQFLQTRREINPDKIGLIGFSQAGWVMPIAASLSKDIQFVISVSGAIDWLSQGYFYSINKFKLENRTPLEIEKSLAFEEKVNALLKKGASYEEYMALIEQTPASNGEPLNRAKWGFAKLNWNVNARESLRRMTCPVLAIFGGQDAYVDVQESMAVYREEVKKLTIKFFPDGDHALFKTDSKRMIHIGWSAIWRLIKLEFVGKSAFPDGYFENLSEWLKKQVN